MMMTIHRYLIYGYTRPKVNNTNAFHNNRQNVKRTKNFNATLINILRFECVKMIQYSQKCKGKPISHLIFSCLEISLISSSGRTFCPFLSCFIC